MDIVVLPALYIDEFPIDVYIKRIKENPTRRYCSSLLFSVQTVHNIT